MDTNTLLRAENNQLRQKIVALLNEKETYLRILACLVDDVGGRVAVPRKDMDKVPHEFHVHFEQTKIKDEGAPDDTAEDAMVVLVKKKSEEPKANGGASKLVIPSRLRGGE